MWWTLTSAVLARAAMPKFSWDTTPVFQQLCHVNGTYGAEFSPEKTAWLAAHFPLVTLEHCQGQGVEAYHGEILKHGYIEDHFLAAAAQIKAVNSSTTVLYYNNQDAAIPFYRLAQAVMAHPEYLIPGCQGSGGHMLPNVTSLCYNLSVPEVQQLWVEHYTNMTRPGSALDGIFIDVASARNDPNVAQEMYVAMQTANPTKILGHVTSLDSQVPYPLKQTYTFAASAKEILALQTCAKQGNICEAHFQPPYNASNQFEAFNETLAAFLVAAGPHSYFAFSTKTPELGIPFCEGPYPTWCYGMGWSDDYLRPLGAPDGDAAVKRVPEACDGSPPEPRTVYTRTFGKNSTRVSLSLATGKGSKAACRIDWADGHVTLCTTAMPRTS